MDDLSLDKLGALRLNLEELRIAYDYCSALPQLLRMRLVQGNEQTVDICLQVLQYARPLFQSDVEVYKVEM